MERPQHQVERQLADAWPPEKWRGLTVIIAVSGGADSVALLRAMIALRDQGAGRLLVGHLNHQLRGVESDQDEAFVRQLAASLDCRCFVGHAGRLRADAPDGLEAAARDARYQFLRELADREGARYVVLGHTFDDQAETILHRIVRGTGIAGLAGMQAARRLSDLTTLVRPLLAVHREQLRDYLHECGQLYREDSSNSEQQYTRNRIRHDLIPLLESQFNAKVCDALVRLGRYADQVQQIIEELVADLCGQHIEKTADGVSLDCSPVAHQPQHVLCEMLIAVWKAQGWPMQAMSGQKWEEVASLVSNELTEAQKICLPGNVIAERTGATLSLTRSA
jgi:tRNA(Ile)-lysidine synthase